MNDGEIIDWLLSGDVAVEFQTRRDLLGEKRPDLQARIAAQGWGKQFMDSRNPKGGWGQSYYHPNGSRPIIRFLNCATSRFHPKLQSSSPTLHMFLATINRKLMVACCQLAKKAEAMCV